MVTRSSAPLSADRVQPKAVHIQRASPSERRIAVPCHKVQPLGPPGTAVFALGSGSNRHA
jgi:hypothetical protein